MYGGIDYVEYVVFVEVGYDFGLGFVGFDGVLYVFVDGFGYVWMVYDVVWLVD